jgi:glycosyltransferase involved in cell wall biosynthesis
MSAQNKLGRIDFSIIVPTYNRSSFVKKAILSSLRQKKVSFEVIVADDCSLDDTKEVVRSIKDKRIRYFRNKMRLGTSENFLKCFRQSRGHYLFTLGDDDLILKENTLYEIRKVMKKHKLGLGKIGSFSYEQDIKNPYSSQILSDKTIVYKPSSTPDILIKSIDFGLGYFSGVIFDLTLLDKKMLKTDHKCYPDHMCNAYHRAAYYLAMEHGVAYIPKHFVVSHLSLSLIPKYFSMKSPPRLFLESTTNMMKEFLSGQKYQNFKKQYLRSQLPLLPNIKYFTDLENYMLVLKRLVEIDNTLLQEPRFLIYASSGFLPKKIIKIVRDLYTSRSKSQIQKILKKYHYSEEVEKLYEAIQK